MVSWNLGVDAVNQIEAYSRRSWIVFLATLVVINVFNFVKRTDIWDHFYQEMLSQEPIAVRAALRRRSMV